MIIIAKIQFNIYLFMFVVVIYSSSHDVKLTFCLWSRNFENGCNKVAFSKAETVNYKRARDDGLMFI